MKYLFSLLALVLIFSCGDDNEEPSMTACQQANIIGVYQGNQSIGPNASTSEDVTISTNGDEITINIPCISIPITANLNECSITIPETESPGGSTFSGTGNLTETVTITSLTLTVVLDGPNNCTFDGSKMN